MRLKRKIFLLLHNLNAVIYIFLKQMTSTYLSWASVIIGGILLFSSCLNSNNANIDKSSDAQVYALALSSNADSTGVLSAAEFTIDQVGKKIFNRDSLSYLFAVDSAKLTLSASSTYSPFSQIILTLKNPDSTYSWNGKDSIPPLRLSSIITTAQDGITTKPYDFKLNIYQQDPNILTWTKVTDNYLASSVSAQKTLAIGNTFFTYYVSGGTLKGASTDASGEKNWTEIDIVGLPAGTTPAMITAAGKGAYALGTDQTVYFTANGATWTSVTTSYHVKAIYGDLPLTTGKTILTVIDDEGTLKFAETENFAAIQVLNTIKSAFPISAFSTAQVNNPTVFSAKYIAVSGGLRSDNTANNANWLLQRKGETIEAIATETSFSQQGSSIFFYDNKLYLMSSEKENGQNILYNSNYGLNWTKVGKNQTFDPEFTYRTQASVITDAENYIWIFGGVSDASQQLVEVWRGRLNKLAGE